ncbi:hypothetical protein H0W80_04250 [Candidatus Saccharibacteria bacterium]|nr:hypothetical protein [Candidatus Saccharibacteria bacterium]
MDKINQVVSITSARKLLGKEALSMSDDQIKDLIFTLTLVAKQYLRYNSSKKALGKNDGK